MSSLTWNDYWRKLRGLQGGGQGDTFLVESIGSHWQGVLKQTKAPHSKKSRLRMQREVSSLNILSYAKARVPSVLDVGNTSSDEKGDQPTWFVMDHIKGDTLHNAVNGGAVFTLDHGLSLSMDLANTLLKAHTSDVIHRDIKPSNLMYDRDKPGEVVLLDCGLTYIDGEDDNDELTRDDPIRNKFITLPSGITPGGNRRDRRLDVVATCGVLLYLFTNQYIGSTRDSQGHLPHKRRGCTIQELFPDDRRKRELELFFDKAFDDNIDNQFQNFHELVERMSSIQNYQPQKFRDFSLVARQRQDELQTTHRRTRLLTCGLQIESRLLPLVRTWQSQLVQKLQGTHYTTGTLALHDINRKLPEGFETLWFTGNIPSALFATTIGYYGHRNTAVFATYKAMSGNEVALMGLFYIVRATQEELPPWEVLFRFTPLTIPEPYEFVPYFDEGIARAIDMLVDDVQGSG